MPGYVQLGDGCDAADTSPPALRDLLEHAQPMAAVAVAVAVVLGRVAARKSMAETKVRALRAAEHLLTTATAGGIARQVIRVATALDIAYSEVSAELADAATGRAATDATRQRPGAYTFAGDGPRGTVFSSGGR